MKQHKKIVLIGAYGYTGKLICELFEENKIPFTAAGRDLEKLKEIQQEFQQISDIISSDISDEKDALKIITGHDIIINTAGPFTEESFQFVQLLSQSKNKIYLDICGESTFVKNSFEENFQSALVNQTVIIHGCAFESMIADLAVRLMTKDSEKINSINTYYSFEHSKPSPGTRMTMKLSKYRNFQKIENGEWSSYKLSEEIKKIDFAEGEKNTAVPYPLPEIVFNYVKYKPKQVMSYLLISREESLFLGDSKNNSGDAKTELNQLKKKAFSGPSETDRKRQQSTIYIQAEFENGESKILKLTTTDMYRITAQCVFISVKKLSDGIPLYGTFCPADLFRNQEHEMLDKLNVKVHLTEK